MDELQEMRFERSCAAAIQALRSERLRCPEPETLIGWAQGARGSADGDTEPRPATADPPPQTADDPVLRQGQVTLHAGACVACLDTVDGLFTESAEVDDVHWARAEQRLDRRAKPWLATAQVGDARSRWAGFAPRIAAAILVGAALGATAVWLALGRSPAPISVERGPAIQIVRPSGEVDELSAFEWALPFPVLLAYRIEVERAGEVVWSATTEAGQERRLSVPEELRSLLTSGEAFRWRVVGLSPAGEEVAASPFVPLRLVPGPPATPDDPPDPQQQGGAAARPRDPP